MVGSDDLFPFEMVPLKRPGHSFTFRGVLERGEKDFEFNSMHP